MGSDTYRARISTPLDTSRSRIGRIQLAAFGGDDDDDGTVVPGVTGYWDGLISTHGSEYPGMGCHST